MGVACGDLDGDGRPDLAVTNFYGESTTFYQQPRPAASSPTTPPRSAWPPPSRHLLGFGIAFLDANNDGRLDLVTANGHVNDYRPAVPWTMPAQLLLGGPSGRLTDVSPRAGPPFEPLHLGRGLAAGDLDNDGRLDAVVLVPERAAGLLPQPDGRRRPLRDAPPRGGAVEPRRRRGARGVRGRRPPPGRPAARRRQLPVGRRPAAPLRPGGSPRVERLEVRWPSGRVDRYEGLSADRGYLVREGDADVRPLQGWQRQPR